MLSLRTQKRHAPIRAGLRVALVVARVQAVAREDDGRGAPVALEAPEGPRAECERPYM